MKNRECSTWKQRYDAVMDALSDLIIEIWKGDGMNKCRWEHSHRDGRVVWESECGFEVALEKKIYSYCPNCGGRIEYGG